MRLCLVSIFLFKLQNLGLTNFNQGKKDQRAVAILVPCLCLCMGNAVTTITTHAHIQLCFAKAEKKSFIYCWGASSEGVQFLGRATSQYLLKIKNAFTILYPHYGGGYTNLRMC